MKLILSFVIGVLIIGVSRAQEETNICSDDPDDLCSPGESGEYLLNGLLLPDAELLDKYCSPFLSSFKCVINYEKTCLPDGQSVMGPHMSTEIAESIAKDICDEHTRIGKVYRANVNCVNGIEDDIHMCSRNASVIRDSYTEYLKTKSEELTTEDEEEIICLQSSLKQGCVETEIQDHCGREAQLLVVELLDRIQLRTPACDAVNMIRLGERFAAYLAEEASEVRKRRKK